MVEVLFVTWVITDEVPALHLLEQTEISFKFPCYYATTLLLKGLLVLKQERPPTFLLQCWLSLLQTVLHTHRCIHLPPYIHHSILTTLREHSLPSRQGCSLVFREVKRFRVTGTSKERDAHTVQLLRQFDSLLISVVSRTYTRKHKNAATSTC